MALYSLYLTNKYGFKLKKATSNTEKKKLRCEYGNTILASLNIDVISSGLEKVDPDGQYLLLSNHRSIIDPCIIEVALQDTNIRGLWVSKKELYNSFFFGKFVRNSGTILLDRESKQMGQFFKAIKNGLNTGASIFVFPEGTRNTEGTDLAEFKEGSQLIAVKNRLPIMPVYIKTNANEIMRTDRNKRQKNLQAENQYSDTIDNKERTISLEQAE